MNKIFGFGLAAAAVVVVLGFGAQLFGSAGSGGVGAGPTTTPEPSVAEPTATPEPTPVVGGNPEGPFILSEGEPSGAGLITVTIAAPGWNGDPGGGLLSKNNNPESSDDAAMIVFEGDLYVYGDPCHWASTTPATPATTVDELVAALAAQASRDASAPVDITVDGHAGKAITLHVPDDAVFSDCDQDRQGTGTFGSWTVSIYGVPGLDPSRYHQGPGQIDEVWILDVDGVVTVLDWTYYSGTPAEDVAELRAIVESATFGQ